MEFIHGMTLSRWLQSLADMPVGLRRREVLVQLAKHGARAGRDERLLDEIDDLGRELV